MAISENTRPAWAGKTDEARRLIAASFAHIETIAAGLKRIQQLSDRRLAQEFPLIQGAANTLSDAESCVEAVLEDLPDIG